MTQDHTIDTHRSLRLAIYSVLIAAAAGSMLGRLLSVNSIDYSRLERYLRDNQGPPDRVLQRPFLSANDRSRWATVRALVEQGTYAIDEIIAEPNWDTIDMVKHVGTDGEPHLYSSKPPLLPTIIAGEYWLIHKATGETLGSQPYAIGRGMLATINILPMILLLLAVAYLVEQFGVTDWGRFAVMTTAAFGTFLNTFSNVLNNHLPAAIAAGIALFAISRIVWQEDRRWTIFVLAGLAAAFTAANELPALAFLAVAGAALLWVSPRLTLIAFTPAVALVALAFFGTNYLAHESLRPPYAHRQDGPQLFEVANLDGTLPQDASPVPDWLRSEFDEHGIGISDEAMLVPGSSGDRWIVQEPPSHFLYSVVKTADGVAVHSWDNWYDYQYERGGRIRDSYWRFRESRSKIDQGEESPAVYALHTLIGHHGIFSLTPMWLLMPLGLGIWLVRGDARIRLLAASIALLTIVCIGFYLTRPLDDRNYGGMTSGFRWTFWFTPLWLVAILPACDWLGRYRAGRGFALVLLALSALSASYPTWNPWTQPWLVDLFNWLGWIDL